ncbi:TIGR04438 family Trp-rich protein [Tepidicella baoligensis]|uniref:TIGR04438 family Trp-rich protein n=1 Tax=Tepidicella baoligensis TaxID=2707016 RepID=UPI0015D99FB1|nr:TIGR04438 family Trp-rich protein [Tepidicella baoligensis]
MGFLILGLILLVLKWAAIGPVAAWSWWWVLAPFPLAALWWWIADATGYTGRKALEREEARKQARKQEGRERLKGFRSNRF